MADMAHKSGLDGVNHTAAAAERQAQTTRAAAVLAASDAHIACVSAGALRLLSTLSSSSHTERLLQPALLTCACFDATGTQLLAAGGDKQVALWRLPSELSATAMDAAVTSPVRRWTHGKKVGCVAFSPDGTMALWADLFGEVWGVSLDDAEAAPTLLLGHLSPVSHLSFSSDGGSIVTSDREGHVRSSHWPHAFVIECYYLSHTTPLQLMLPLRHAPLLVTAAAAGRGVCFWRAHSGVLLGKMSAARLLLGGDDGAAVERLETGGASAGVGGATAEGGGGSGILGGCEVLREVGSLIALLFSGRASVHFVATRCTWDAVNAELLPRPELTVPLPEEPVAVSHSRGSGHLCVLLASGALVLVDAAAGGGAGFDATSVRAITLRATPGVGPSCPAPAGLPDGPPSP